MDYAKLTVKLHPTEQYSVEKRIQVLRSILDDENASLDVKITNRVLFYFGSLNYLPKGEFLKNREQCCHYCGLSYNRGYAAAIKEQAYKGARKRNERYQKIKSEVLNLAYLHRDKSVATIARIIKQDVINYLNEHNLHLKCQDPTRTIETWVREAKKGNWQSVRTPKKE